MTIPNPPPPRSGHRAVVVGGSDACLFVFGGEYTSPKGDQVQAILQPHTCILTGGGIIASKGAVYPTGGGIIASKGAVYPTGGGIIASKGALYPTGGGIIASKGAVYPTGDGIIASKGAVYPTGRVPYTP